jgi:asparagine synthase (glutamine-hydrolysing)
MAGFNLSINGKYIHKQTNDNKFDYDVMNGENYFCRKFMVKKFEKDKVFAENNSFLIIIDGVILNKTDLEQQFLSSNWFETIINIYLSNGDIFFNVFRGSFSGVLYDKKKDKWIIFSDQIGTKFIYYTFSNGTFFCSSMIKDIYFFFQQNSIHYELNIENAYLLLSYGYMLEDHTLCSQIKKIRPGCYLVFEKGELSEYKYYTIDNTPNYSLSENDAIELIDKNFKKAVSLQFEKDREYGYQHLVALSGGLDSRMTCWVAHELGYTEQLNYTYSQSDYIDEIVPKKIARDLKHEWIFKALDNGLWLYNIDEITAITGGNVLYYGLAHGYSFLKYLNLSTLGMIHSGQIGGPIMSTFFTSLNPNQKFKFGDGAYSLKYLNRVKDIVLSEEFSNQELAKFYYRSFSGINSGQILLFEYSETFSPFFNIDFMNIALSIPLKYRYNHAIHKKWILKKYPKAANYVWEKIGAKINEPILKIGNKNLPIFHIIKRLTTKLHNQFNHYTSNNSMNPIAYYIKTNDELRNFIDTYFKETIELVNNKMLKNDLLETQQKGGAIEKIQALSLLSAIKLFNL